MTHGYTHPATARRNELIRQGWTVIASVVEIKAHMKFPAGCRYISTGEVLAPPAKQQEKAA